MGNSTNLGLFFETSVALFWISVSSSVRLSIPSNSEPLVLLMMEDRSRADIATLQRRDVETSRRCCLMTFSLVDLTSRCCNVTTLQRHDVETLRRCCLMTFSLVDLTSRRWNITTWERRDVGTSRRGNVTTLERRDAPALSCIAFHCSTLLPKSALFTSFSPALTEIAILRYRAIKNTFLNAK